MKECRIYYESWQLQCCGDPFSVGERVEWTCAKPDEFNNYHGITMDYVEDHHGDDTHLVTGTITRIISERSETPKSDKPISINYDEVEIIREDIQYADGWEGWKDDDDTMCYTMWGYIVELKDVNVEKVRNKWNKEYEKNREKLPQRIFLRRRKKNFMHTKYKWLI